MILAEFAACAATVAKRFIHLGYRNRDNFLFKFIAFEEQVCVGFFHVTVQKLHGNSHCARQIYGYGGFAGSALAGSD